jgi:protocatechuate 3,4-dioxygenase beta subunit
MGGVDAGPVHGCYHPLAKHGAPVANDAAAAPAGQARTCVATEANIEGPFFKPDAPKRVVLVDERSAGTRLSLSGRVLSTRCEPLAGAILEVWHADHAGVYDNRGFGFRATLVCDAEGKYALQTVVPGRYLNGDRYRPAHVHFKVHAPRHRSLTTQLYFDGDPYNEGDPFIRSSLIVPIERQYTSWSMARDFSLTAA